MQALGLSAVSDIVDQSPGAVKGGRAEIIGVPRDHIAGGVTDRAVDALDCRIHGAPPGGIRREICDCLVAAIVVFIVVRIVVSIVVSIVMPIVVPCRGGVAWRETAFGALPFGEEFRHIAHQIFDDRQVSQRRQFELLSARDVFHISAASPARPAIDHHRAGAAHANAAGKAVTQARFNIALNPGYHVEHRLAWLLRHPVVGYFPTGLVAPPHGDADFTGLSSRHGWHGPVDEGVDGG